MEVQQPFLLIGSPPCTAFSQLFSSNISRMDPARVHEKMQEALIHLKFCIELYIIQLQNGRYFLHEHPWGAWSWRVPELERLLALPEVKKAKGHMCQQDMYI